MVTVIVGNRTDSNTCRVLTTTESVTDRYVEFNIPSETQPLAPGKPAWANYVKGVVNCFKGNILSFAFL